MPPLRVSRLAPWALLSCVACRALNPEFDPDEQAGELGSSEGAEAEAEVEGSSGSIESEGESEGELESETGPDPETGPEPSECGDGVLDPQLEDCDDGNEASDDGCLADCSIPLSCLDILEFAPDSPTGDYLIDPRELGQPWPARCEMDFEGGGWTGIGLEDLLCSDHLANWITAISQAPSEGIEGCYFYAEYFEGGALEYYWDIEFPPGFDAFFLREYAVQAIGEPELNFAQIVWEQPALFPNGSLSFGSAYDEGPITTWLSEANGEGAFFTDLEIRTYPSLDKPFELFEGSDLLRIGFGERGQTAEGLVPWYGGRIFVR